MNILFIVFILLIAIKIRSGYKKGMVKEIITFVSLLITSITVALIANGLSHYSKGHILNVIIVLILLSLLGLVHLLLKPIFFSAKLISKLPIVSWADKLLGILVGIVESTLLLWTLYFFVMIMELGGIGEQILQCTRDNGILLWLFGHNYLAAFLEKVSSSVTFLPHLL